MGRLWPLLLALGTCARAQELITCAVACDSCGGPFPLDEQEIYCEMCRECGNTIATSTKPSISKFTNTNATKSVGIRTITTQPRDHRSDTVETATRRIRNAAVSASIRCNGDKKCFYRDKYINRKIEFFCPEQAVPFCDEIEFEEKASTIAGRWSTRLLCPPTLYCKERPPTSTRSTIKSTTTQPPITPPQMFLQPMRFHVPPQHMPTPHMPFLQTPMPMMLPQAHFPYYQPQPQGPPNFYPPTPPPMPLPAPLLLDFTVNPHDIRRLSELMSNPEGRLLSEYLEREGNYLAVDIQKDSERDRQLGVFNNL